MGKVKKPPRDIDKTKPERREENGAGIGQGVDGQLQGSVVVDGAMISPREIITIL